MTDKPLTLLDGAVHGLLTTATVRPTVHTY